MTRFQRVSIPLTLLIGLAFLQPTALLAGEHGGSEHGGSSAASSSSSRVTTPAKASSRDLQTLADAEKALKETRPSLARRLRDLRKKLGGK